MCDNVKSVFVWTVSFGLASRSFKNTGLNNSQSIAASVLVELSMIAVKVCLRPILK